MFTLRSKLVSTNVGYARDHINLSVAFETDNAIIYETGESNGTSTSSLYNKTVTHMGSKYGDLPTGTIPYGSKFIRVSDQTVVDTPETLRLYKPVVAVTSPPSGTTSISEDIYENETQYFRIYKYVMVSSTYKSSTVSSVTQQLVYTINGQSYTLDHTSDYDGISSKTSSFSFNHQLYDDQVLELTWTKLIDIPLVFDVSIVDPGIFWLYSIMYNVIINNINKYFSIVKKGDTSSTYHSDSDELILYPARSDYSLVNLNTDNVYYNPYSAGTTSVDYEFLSKNGTVLKSVTLKTNTYWGRQCISSADYYYNIKKIYLVCDNSSSILYFNSKIQLQMKVGNGQVTNAVHSFVIIQFGAYYVIEVDLDSNSTDTITFYNQDTTSVNATFNSRTKYE